MPLSVDPHKESGQNLYRQYAGKKGKIVLDARWVQECVNAGVLQTFHTNWAGCKVLGTEQYVSTDPLSRIAIEISLFRVGSTEVAASAPVPVQSQPRRLSRQSQQQPDTMPRHVQPAQTMHSQTMDPMPGGPVDQIVHPPSTFQYVYTTLHPGRAMHPTAPAPPQTWQGPNSIAPQQTHVAPPHMIPRQPHAYRPESWDGNYNQAPPPASLVGGPGYDFRYRNEESDWSHGGPSDYYDPAVCPSTFLIEFYHSPLSQQFDHYDQQQYIPETEPQNGESSTQANPEPVDKPRGRKRQRAQVGFTIHRTMNTSEHCCE